MVAWFSITITTGGRGSTVRITDLIPLQTTGQETETLPLTPTPDLIGRDAVSISSTVKRAKLLAAYGDTRRSTATLLRPAFETVRLT